MEKIWRNWQVIVQHLKSSSCEELLQELLQEPLHVEGAGRSCCYWELGDRYM